MRFLILLVCVLFLTGCVGNRFDHVKYDSDGKITERWTLQGYKFNVNDEKKKLIIILSDGSILSAGQIITTADPNSMKAIGEAFGKFGRVFLIP